MLECAIASSLSDLAQAAATLRRGTDFIAAGLQSPPGRGTTRAATGNSKVIGNGLREIDRFLSILIDAVADGLVVDAADRRTLRSQRNTARKLTALRTTLALASPDDAALRAIGRSRACLFHTAGIVRHAGPHSAPTHGWAHPDAATAVLPPARFAIGDRLDVSIADLRRIGRFYDRIADDLLALSVRKTGFD